MLMLAKRLKNCAAVMRSAFMAACVLGYAPTSYAATEQETTLIEGAKLCTRYLPRHERQYGIPEHLLAAIASSESGRFHRGLGLNLPWPWTINVNGRGYFFDTKEEAIAAVNKFRAAGYQSIDIGCMQVNLRHHPKAFASVEQAFDPAYNVGYAASFLKRNFMEEGTWRKATAAYHSRTDSYGSPYASRVFGAWSRIVSKVADARAGRPVINNYAKTDATKTASKSTGPARIVRPSYRSLHMRSITVASNDKKTTSREKGVLVVRPQRPQRTAASEDIVFQNTAPAQDASSRSVKVVALKPAQVAALDNTQDAKNIPTPMENKPIKVVSLTSSAASQSTTPTPASVAGKGQFVPKAKVASTATLDKDAVMSANKANKLFVFDY